MRPEKQLQSRTSMPYTGNHTCGILRWKEHPNRQLLVIVLKLATCMCRRKGFVSFSDPLPNSCSVCILCPTRQKIHAWGACVYQNRETTNWRVCVFADSWSAKWCLQAPISNDTNNCLVPKAPFGSALALQVFWEAQSLATIERSTTQPGQLNRIEVVTQMNIGNS